MLKAYLIFIAVMSLIAFALYLSDKVKAKQRAWRIPEKVLLGIGFFGGAIGALAGMQIFRHKTKHVYFYIVNLLGLVLQGALAYLIIKYL